MGGPLESKDSRGIRWSQWCVRAIALLSPLLTLLLLVGVRADEGYPGQEQLALPEVQVAAVDIYTDTVWAAANGPYTVTLTYVHPTATLTIEPGVVVTFEGNGILAVYGQLVAEGAPSDHITFISSSQEQPGSIRFLRSPDGTWNSRGSRIRYADFTYTWLGGDSSGPEAGPTYVAVSRSGFFTSTKTISLPRYSLFSENVITQSSAFYVAYFTYSDVLSNTIVENSGYRLVTVGNSTVRGNLIANNFYNYGSSLEVTSPSTVTNNTIVYNGSTIYVDDLATITSNNVFSNNLRYYDKGCGHQEYGISIDDSAAVSDSSPCGGASEYVYIPIQMYASPGRFSVTATDNWWGTDDPALVDQHIYDYWDNPERGTVNYVPIATSLVADAPPVPTPAATPYYDGPYPTPTPIPPVEPPGGKYPTPTVGGHVYTDTVWTLANSPYIISSIIYIYPSATLTIEAGVRVNFAFNPLTSAWGRLSTLGRLVVQGEPDNPVSFTGPSATESGGNQLDLSSGSTIRYAEFNGGRIGTTTSSDKIDIVVVNSRFLSSTVYLGNVFFSQNIATGSQETDYGWGGYYWFWNSQVVSNTFWGVGPNVGGCAINISNTAFTNNLFVHNSGYLCLDWAAIITYNTIAHNRGGINQWGPVTISYNNIYDNTRSAGTYDLIGYGSPYAGHTNAINNWWGTTDISEIYQHTYDYWDDPNFAPVDYNPIATGPVEGARTLYTAYLPLAANSFSGGW